MNPSRAAGSRPHRLLAGLAGLALAAGLAGGCTAARSVLGTTDSACYLALPAAAQAAGSHHKLTGVRLFRVDSLRQRYPKLDEALPTTANPKQRVCVFGFSGRFARSSVSRPYGKDAGHFAVVVLDAPSNQLVGTVIFDHQPPPLGHTHIG